MQYAVSGAPCAGKSTVIQALNSLGFPVVKEVATEVIAEGSICPVENHVRFQFECLYRQERAERAIAGSDRPLFVDRGVYDLEAYRAVYGRDLPQFLKGLGARRYEALFLFEQLPEWEDNGIRYESIEFGRELSRYLRRVYQSHGVPVIEVPFARVWQRVEQVLTMVK